MYNELGYLWASRFLAENDPATMEAQDKGALLESIQMLMHDMNNNIAEGGRWIAAELSKKSIISQGMLEWMLSQALPWFKRQGSGLLL
jgi:hypothetical protein